MLQTFPKHPVGWSETVVNVPADLPHGYHMDTQTLKSNYFIFLFFYLNREAYICINQSNQPWKH